MSHNKALRVLVYQEAAALRRIGRRIRAKAIAAQEEADRVARKTMLVSVTCKKCQCTHEIIGSSGRKFKRCPRCAEEGKRAQAKKYRKTPSGRAGRKRAKTLRRAKCSIEAEAIDPIAVFERDGWRCHICHKRTPKKLRGTYEDQAPELDHIISLAEGGDHTWSNVACSCRRCNGLKGSRSMGQLNMPWAA